MTDDQKKICPLKIIGMQNAPYCGEEDCAWWCKWTKDCALVAIAGEISDRLSEIREAIDR